MTNKTIPLLIAGISTLAALNTLADGTHTNTPLCDMACCQDLPSHWSLEATSGAEFGNVRVHNLDSYTIVPAVLGLAYTFDHICLPDFAGGAFAGRPEALLDGYYTRVVSGVEHYITGFHVGGRYDFISPGGRWVPFAETTVGLADADARQFQSNGDVHGLGQHFNFNFTIGTGVRYDISSRFFARLTVQYAHYSNAGLSEPQHQNKAIDCAGPLLGIGIRL